MVETFLLKDDGTFPNNERLPLLVYRGALNVARGDAPAEFEDRFRSSNWGGSWRNGVYTYHHYHSTAHEVLGVSRGSARLQLGGEAGEILRVEAGDVLVIPAGVAHKNLESSPDFLVVGAYPDGQNYDMNYGEPSERPAADENIAAVALPDADPVYGGDGPLLTYWGKR